MSFMSNEDILQKNKLLFLENKIRTEKIIALSSLTEDNKHILIFDFDGIEYYDMIKSISYTQRYNGLGIMYIFNSSNGYNAICLDKLHIQECNHIKMNTRFSDYAHTKIGFKSGSWCWRIGEDKLFIKELLPCDNYKHRNQSNAHKLFLETKYNLDIEDFGNFDLGTKLFFESYKNDVI